MKINKTKPNPPKRPSKKFLESVFSPPLSIFKYLYLKAQKLFNKLSPIFDFRKFSQKKKNQFFLNIIIGTLVVIAFHLLESTNLGESTINTFFDKFITEESLEAAEVDISLGNSEIVFVDIDHKTYIEWGEPLITPRDKLAEVIELAYMHDPKLIVLDILLENVAGKKDNDRKLRDVLKNILKDSKNTNTKIIFSYRIGFDKDMEKEILKETIVNDLIMSTENMTRNGGFKKFYPTSPYISRSTSDYVERYWNLYEIYTDKKGNRSILWGLPLLAAILSNQREMTCLEKFKKKIIDSKETFAKGVVEELEFPNGKKIKLPANKSDIYLQRIR
ncbi:MAG: CHASE2 domain-containing protein, partial [Candidatus Aminicenantes bacterium]